MSATDTIAAIATPPGRGGIGVLRISGSRTRAIAQSLLSNVPAPRQVCVRDFHDADGSSLDRGVALFFQGPASFTGEDVLELHAHGGPVLMDLLLARTIQLGARVAQPGEFSQRAFLNDKLDLAQAEAIADLIDSGSQQAARAAVRSLQGEFSARIHALLASLIEARMYIEAAIDFPEEEVDFLGDKQVRRRLDDLSVSTAEILASAAQGALLREGMTVVIAGRPNAGKSSLLNSLAGYEAAIVTPIPGTTRDVLRERISIDGLPLHIVDTAGLRATDDEVESEGIRRARNEMAKADRILYLVDASASVSDAELADDLAPLSENNVTLLYNKIDLTLQSPQIVRGARDAIYLSVQSGAGIDLLRQYLKDCVGYVDINTGIFSARRRHLDALRRTQIHIATALQLLTERRAGELMAEELRQAQHCLGEITGEFTSDDLLGKIFSSFCIGK
ncbi:MAG TPA: tRNA uridine-5-carboxymethylaminomethyl(34) synthesis GTPase MnmE [Steroidobacteraceae bacterium]|nr:tRNA uridine-5-carboxymethylaminomethyl(34) synthesis GTPase MnmE [Steroidobacteraceae bacterium]